MGRDAEVNNTSEVPAPIESVDRALRLLLHLRSHSSISVKEAAVYLGTAPSTAHRLLSTLMLRGFVVQDFERRYRLGAALSDVLPTQVTDSDLIEAAQGPLIELMGKLQETVQLMVLREGNIRFLEGEEPEAILRVTKRVGDEMPAFVSAGGKAILGRMTNPEVERIYRQGLEAWPTRKVQSMQMLKRMLTQVRRDGYGISREETEPGISGVGVCISAPDGAPIGALTTAVPSVRFHRREIQDYVSALRSAVQKVENNLYGRDDVSYSF